MPAPPEFCNAGRNIRQIKVGRAVKAKHGRQTVAHLTVAGKVKVELQAVCDNAQPRQRGRGVDQPYAARTDDIRPQCADGIRQYDLFGQTEHKHFCAALGPCQRAAVCRIMQLVGHFTVFDNRTHNQLREEKDIRRKGHKVFLRRNFAGVHIDLIADDFKDVVAYSQRQHRAKAQRCDAEMSNLVQRVNQEVGVLEIHQHPQIDHHRHHRKQPAQSASSLCRHQCAQIVKDYQHRNQRQEFYACPAVKGEAFCQQHCIFGAAGHQIIQQQG